MDLPSECARYIFDNSYFPSAEEVSLLSEVGYPMQKPEWLGFVHENKPYKLEEDQVELPQEVPLGLDASEYYKMEKIINPYLKRSFELKRLQTGASVLKEGFHGTRASNIDSIARNNFNWRLAGARKTDCRHGKGVYFSPLPLFAAAFSPEEGDRKVFIQTDYLFKNACIGSRKDGLLPFDPACDTVKSPNGNVFVKFEDNEFLPLHVYHITVPLFKEHINSIGWQYNKIV